MLIKRNTAIECCLLLISFLSTAAFGQKILLIEKAGNPHTERIQVFEELTFQLKEDDKGWYKRQIMDLNADAQLVLLGDTWTPLSDISRIRLRRQRAWSNVIGGALMGGGASMFLGDLWYTVVRDEPRLTQGGMEFGLLNIAVGAGIRSLFSPVKYKMGDRRRLRVIDVTY